MIKPTIIILGAFVLFSCSQDRELSQSIFVPDPSDSQIPAKTSLGYNTFGAYYDRQLYLNDNIDIPLKIINNGDYTTFRFYGNINGSSPLDMLIQLNNFDPKNFEDLMELDAAVYDLEQFDGEFGLIRSFNDTLDIQLLNGSFSFTKVKRLKVDGDVEGVILSGEFQLQIKMQQHISISDGRFDVIVNELNFFVE